METDIKSKAQELIRNGVNASRPQKPVIPEEMLNFSKVYYTALSDCVSKLTERHKVGDLKSEDFLGLLTNLNHPKS